MLTNLGLLEYTSICDDIDQMNCLGWPIKDTIVIIGNSSIYFN